MNIFFLDNDPKLAAKYHCDKHCVKMILESAQLLSSVYHLTNSSVKDKVYRLTHQNHPMAKWARESLSNWKWLRDHHVALLNEYTFRYGKQHLTGLTKTPVFIDKLPNIQDIGFTSPPQCMPDEVKLPDLIDAYRNYYTKVKLNTIQVKYSKREWPEWLSMTGPTD